MCRRDDLIMLLMKSGHAGDVIRKQQRVVVCCGGTE